MFHDFPVAFPIRSNTAKPTLLLQFRQTPLDRAFGQSNPSPHFHDGSLWLIMQQLQNSPVLRLNSVFSATFRVYSVTLRGFWATFLTYSAILCGFWATFLTYSAILRGFWATFLNYSATFRVYSATFHILNASLGGRSQRHAMLFFAERETHRTICRVHRLSLNFSCEFFLRRARQRSRTPAFTLGFT